MPDPPSSEWQVYAGFLPEGPPDEDTEFAFIEGVAFVNARKHEQVVTRHCAERDLYRERLEKIARDGDSLDCVIEARDALFQARESKG